MVLWDLWGFRRQPEKDMGKIVRISSHSNLASWYPNSKKQTFRWNGADCSRSELKSIQRPSLDRNPTPHTIYNLDFNVIILYHLLPSSSHIFIYRGCPFFSVISCTLILMSLLSNCGFTMNLKGPQARTRFVKRRDVISEVNQLKCSNEKPASRRWKYHIHYVPWNIMLYIFTINQLRVSFII